MYSAYTIMRIAIGSSKRVMVSTVLCETIPDP